jgi:hypothetical protein
MRQGRFDCCFDAIDVVEASRNDVEAGIESAPRRVAE